MRKTHLWISLIVGLGVWGFYFAHVIQSLRSGDTGGLVWWFLGALVLVMVLEAGATGLIAWLFRRRSRSLDDGPTLDAALRASHVALMLLITMILGFAALISIPALRNWFIATLNADIFILGANILLAMVVIAELTRAAVTLALMPRR